MRYVTYDGEPKEHTVRQLRSILARVEGALSPHAKVRFEITVRWMEPDDKGVTAVTWSNKRRR